MTSETPAEKLWEEALRCCGYKTLLLSYLSCAVCKGPLVDAVSTRCGHMFCDICLKKWSESGKISLQGSRLYFITRVKIFEWPLITRVICGHMLTNDLDQSSMTTQSCSTSQKTKNSSSGSLSQL